MDENSATTRQQAALRAGEPRDDRPGRPRGLIQARLIAGVALVAFLLGVAAVFLIDRSGVANVGALFRSAEAEVAPPPASPSEPDPAPAVESTRAQAPSASVETTPPPAATGGEDEREALARAERVEQVVEAAGGLDQRVAAMEQRLARLDLQAQAAAGNTARAEGLLIAFAARRAIERGAPLGYLADQLRLRFGDSRPNAVQAVIDMAQDPVTLDQLLSRLDRLRPELGQAPAGEGPLSWLSRELGQLFVVRHADSPSPAAQQRLERARLFLESGRADAAVEEVLRLPNAAAASDWAEDARRYAAAHRALELLEITAILETRGLRDGSGNAVEQPSPAVAEPVAAEP